MRISNPQNSPLNIIAKILLNSLYGRFGMNPDKPNYLIFCDSPYKDTIYPHNEVKDIIDFGNGKELYSYTPKFKNQPKFSYDYSDSKILINVSKAASITGLSWIFMSLFKNNPKVNLYYSDTDSIFIDNSLANIYPDLVGTELGQLKFDYEFKEAVFYLLRYTEVNFKVEKVLLKQKE